MLESRNGDDPEEESDALRYCVRGVGIWTYQSQPCSTYRTSSASFSPSKVRSAPTGYSVQRRTRQKAIYLNRKSGRLFRTWRLTVLPWFLQLRTAMTTARLAPLVHSRSRAATDSTLAIRFATSEYLHVDCRLIQATH